MDGMTIEVIHKPEHKAVSLDVYHPDGRCFGVDVISEAWGDDRAIEQCLKLLNDRISDWPIGPFTVEDVRAHDCG